MKTITLLGSTGSIGLQTLDVCRRHNIKVRALSARGNYAALAGQAREFSVEYACISEERHYKDLKELLKDTKTKVLCGVEGMCKVAGLDGSDALVNAVVGMAGLLPTLKAVEAGTDIALANKETLVAGGGIVMELAKKNGVKVFPIDSEHSAIFQCIQGSSAENVRKIILTGSGGPFFGKTKDELSAVTAEQALSHPNWNMGNKITIDSATLMNKGLEAIEAGWLFGIDGKAAGAFLNGEKYDGAIDLEIIIHRESVIHSAVEFRDNSVIAQLGVPDMKIPIQYALTYPERMECDVKRLSLADYGKLSFYKPDFEAFPCLGACLKAMSLGGAYPCIVNGAGEEAVKLFLQEKISFLNIGELVSGALESFPPLPLENYDDVVRADAAAREYVLAEAGG